MSDLGAITILLLAFLALVALVWLCDAVAP
jgi:hypothetical protein